MPRRDRRPFVRQGRASAASAAYGKEEMPMREEFEEPHVDVVELGGADVIASSTCAEPNQLVEMGF